LQEEDAANPQLLAMDVGVDANDFRPVSFNEVVAYMEPREEAFWAWKEGMERQ
jgi:calcineurin-like phosphoesterase family protein